MKTSVAIVGAIATLAVGACSLPATSTDAAAPASAAAPATALAVESPAGTYALDKSHASLVFTVSHLGFSNYTGAFKSFDATLQFDPQNPAAMRVEARIDPASLDIPAPPEGFLAELIGPAWLGASDFPLMTFASTSVEPTGADTARVTGNFTFRGVTAPVVLEVRYNGGYKGFPPYDPAARIGFSATGALNRSAFGVSMGLPPQGSTMGVGDEVRFEIEAEFTGPPAQ